MKEGETDDFGGEEAEERKISYTFPFDALTAAYRPPVEALMEFFKIDALLPVMSALGVNSASLGAGLQVRSNRAMTRPNLYQVVAAKSGTCKTLVQNALQEPINQIQIELMEKHKKDALPKLQAEDKLLDIKIRDLLKIAKEKDAPPEAQAELEELIARDGAIEDELNGAQRLWTADITSQALGSAG